MNKKIYSLLALATVVVSLQSVAGEKLMEPPKDLGAHPTTIYPVIPGTRTPDYGSDDKMILKNGIVYPIIPGTNTPDYGKPVLKIK